MKKYYTESELRIMELEEQLEVGMKSRYVMCSKCLEVVKLPVELGEVELGAGFKAHRKLVKESSCWGMLCGVQEHTALMVKSALAKKKEE